MALSEHDDTADYVTDAKGNKKPDGKLRDTEKIPLKEDIDEEDFAKLKTNFNIPSLGKLTCTYDRMLGVKKRFKIIKQLREKKC